jgi:Domain of unknown function (DUF4399)
MVSAFRIATFCAVLVLPSGAYSEEIRDPTMPYLYIIYPPDGATVRGAFWCRFGLRNMGVTHAGDQFLDAGHHHLLIDVDEPLNPHEPIPQDKKHLHFGAGQTEARLDLPPGEHTLQLVLGDAEHRPFGGGGVVSKRIRIAVEQPRRRQVDKIDHRAMDHYPQSIRARMQGRAPRRSASAGLTIYHLRRSYMIADGR